MGALRRSTSNLDTVQRNCLLKADASGDADQVDDGASKMVAAIFLKSSTSNIAQGEYRKNIFSALARVMVAAGQTVTNADSETRINEFTARHEAIFSPAGGHDLLVNDYVMPTIHDWAIRQIASNSTWTFDALKNGWASPLVSTAYSDPVAQRYLKRGVALQTLGREALHNTKGQALTLLNDASIQAWITPITIPFVAITVLITGVRTAGCHPQNDVPDRRGTYHCGYDTGHRLHR